MKQIFESKNICFVEVSELLVKEYLAMVNDIENVARLIGRGASGYGDYEKAVQYGEKALSLDSDMLSSFEESFRSDAKACLYFNTNNLVVKKLIASPVTEKTKACIEILYVNALLSGHFPLLNHEMKTLNDNLYTLML